MSDQPSPESPPTPDQPDQTPPDQPDTSTIEPREGTDDEESTSEPEEEG